MPSTERAIPRAYFITFTCYGTWLHGERATSVNRYNNIPQTEFLSFDSTLHANAIKNMREQPYCFKSN